MTYRRLALLLGVTALGISLIAIVFPSLVAFSLDRILVSVIGALALIQALRVVQARRHDGLDEAMTPDPEVSAPADTPGDDLESVLGQFLDTRNIYLYRTRIREALHSAAVAVLTQYGAYSEGEVEEALAAGSWTDDPYAAELLGDDKTLTVPIRARLRSIASRESSLHRSIRHTVEEIAETAGVTVPSSEAAAPNSRFRIRKHRNSRRDTTPTQFTTTKDFEGQVSSDRSEIVTIRESHPTGHWRGVSVVALIGIGIGILVEQPAVLLAGVVGIGFAAYAFSAALPPGSVSIDRSLSDSQPEPGDDVEVTVTITNESDRFLPDLRFVDGVPAALAVEDGSPRLGTALRPRDSATFSYTITARRGVHTFEPALIVARDLTNAIEEEQLLPAETTLTCIPPLRPVEESVPLRDQTAQFVGRVETASGGEGTEFYATREYRPGDALSRIDWNRRARTGEFTTIEFREERAATVVILIDARETAYVAHDQETPHAVDRSVEAAGQMYATLSQSGDQVGLAATSSNSFWLAPGSGVANRVEARELLATHPTLTPRPKQNGSVMIRWRNQFLKRLSPGTQIIFLTPLHEKFGRRLARRLDEHGFPVTVISPDPTADRTTGHLLARVARALHISALRGAGIPVIDLPREETVDVALARHNERWSH